jgi:hypothetical protein
MLGALDHAGLDTGSVGLLERVLLPAPLGNAVRVVDEREFVVTALGAP